MCVLGSAGMAGGTRCDDGAFPEHGQGDLAGSALPCVPCAMAFAHRAALVPRLCVVAPVQQ